MRYPFCSPPITANDDRAALHFESEARLRHCQRHQSRGARLRNQQNPWDFSRLILRGKTFLEFPYPFLTLSFFDFCITTSGLALEFDVALFFLGGYCTILDFSLSFVHHISLRFKRRLFDFNFWLVAFCPFLRGYFTYYVRLTEEQALTATI